MSEERVRLLTIEEGKELTVPLSRLSEKDRGWLRDMEVHQFDIAQWRTATGRHSIVGAL